jgi:UDPglucose 6-dehydrogenase
MRLAVIGAGHVGLVSSVCLAAKGHHVVCVDKNAGLVAQLKLGEPRVYERGLEGLLRQTLDAKTFSVTTDFDAALAASEMVIIAVGTPTQNGAMDFSYVVDAARSIGEHLKNRSSFLSVVVKSSVIPGTTDTLVRKEIESASGKKLPAFGLGMNPEFLREGEAVSDFMAPDRIVLGYEDEQTLALLEILYAPWNVDKLRVNSRSAELIKYASNMLLATQISAINEIANLAAELGDIDILEVLQGIHLDQRWNPAIDGRRVTPGILKYLIPGCGFGGSCLPKDVQALRSQGVGLGLPMHMLNAVLAVNSSQPYQVVQMLEREGVQLAGQTVMILGLAFKPGTDDARESASFKIVESLLDKNARVLIHDPIAADNFRRGLGACANHVTVIKEWAASLEAARIIIVATRWPEYNKLAQCDLTGKIVFDARDMFRPEDFASGKYLSIGRRTRDV